VATLCADLACAPEQKSSAMPKTISTSIIAALRSPSFLPICFIAFIGLRLMLILFVPVTPSSDAAWYFERAATLVEEGTYSERNIRTAFWPVGYPAFLAGLFHVTGVSLLAAKLANLACATLSLWLVYLCAQRMLGDELAARGAVLLMTVYPNNAAYVPLLLSETFYTMLLLLGSVALLGTRTTRNAFVAGVALGVATLVKTQTILLVPLLALASMPTLASWRSCSGAFLRSAAVTVMALAVVAPWTWRNHSTFGEFVLVSTNGGVSLLAGNNRSMVGNYQIDYSMADPVFKQVHFSVENQLQADKEAKHLAVQWIKDNPADFVSLIPQKTWRLWSRDGEGEWGYQAGTPWYDQSQVWFRTVRVVNQVFYGCILLLFAIALARLLRERAPMRAYYGAAIAAAFTLISMVFSGQSRYHFPAMPFMLMYAAWVVTAIVAKRAGGTCMPLLPHGRRSG
jgi:hypothetical protein